MTDKPQRAHRLDLTAEGDTAEALAVELEALAGAVRKGMVPSGCRAGYYGSAQYSYQHDPAQTHQRYVADLERHLKHRRRAATSEEG